MLLNLSNQTKTYSSFFLTGKRNSTKDLQEVMKDANIGDLYSKFESKGVTVDVIWELPDTLVNDFLELNDMEKFRYENAKKKCAHSV